EGFGQCAAVDADLRLRADRGPALVLVFGLLLFGAATGVSYGPVERVVELLVMRGVVPHATEPAVTDELDGLADAEHTARTGGHERDQRLEQLVVVELSVERLEAGHDEVGDLFARERVEPVL